MSSWTVGQLIFKPPLPGMTQDKAGFPINVFPWTKDYEDESRQLILDISQAKFFLAGTDKNCKDDGVKLH